MAYRLETVLLYDPADMAWLRRCLDEKLDGATREVEEHKLNAMRDFAVAQTCRRQVLLHYFGQHSEKPCGNCDICLDPPKQFNATEVAQKHCQCVSSATKFWGEPHYRSATRNAKPPYPRPRS